MQELSRRPGRSPRRASVASTTRPLALQLVVIRDRAPFEVRSVEIAIRRNPGKRYLLNPVSAVVIPVFVSRPALLERLVARRQPPFVIHTGFTIGALVGLFDNIVLVVVDEPPAMFAARRHSVEKLCHSSPFVVLVFERREYAVWRENLERSRESLDLFRRRLDRIRRPAARSQCSAENVAEQHLLADDPALVVVLDQDAVQDLLF